MKDFKGKTVAIKSGHLTIFAGLCKGCELCITKCPQKSLKLSAEAGVYNTPVPEVDPNTCILCGICENICPDCAISVEKNV